MGVSGCKAGVSDFFYYESKFKIYFFFFFWGGGGGMGIVGCVCVEGVVDGWTDEQAPTTTLNLGA